MVEHPVIHTVADAASKALLHDTVSYGSALYKFHIFSMDKSVYFILQSIPQIISMSSLKSIMKIIAT